MNKEPIGLYIFRFVMGLGLFAFMCMLYWSSTLVEIDLKELRQDISQLKNDLFAMRIDNEKGRTQLLQVLMNRQEGSNHNSAEVSVKTPSPSQASNGDFPNLLRADPFYENVLPKLLGKSFVPHGIQHTATVGKPNNLHPFANWVQVSSWIGLCTVSAAKSEFGKFETMSPDMALSIEERPNAANGAIEYWIHLRDNVFWQPLKHEFFPQGTLLAPQFLRKNQVTAEDYKFYFDALMNPYVQLPGAVSLRTYLSAIEEIKIVDKLTFIVRWKAEEVMGSDGKKTPKVKYIAKLWTGHLRPLASFVYKYFADGKKIVEDDNDPETYRTNSVWAQNFTEHWAKNIIVSCGPWIFDGMNDRQIKFKRNADFYDPLAALSDGMEVDIKDSPDNVWQEFKSDHLDSYTMQPDQLLEYKEFLTSAPYLQQAAKGDSIKRLDYVGRSYSYIGWNGAKPFFQKVKVRQALTMSIDRRRIIDQNLNGMGIETTGTFYRFSPSYDHSIIPWPYNPVEARRLLEEEGWSDSDGDGIIDKLIDGKRVPFSFSLTYYVKNPTSKSIAEYVSTALKEVGIDCRLNGVDITDLSAMLDDKSFDAYLLAWSLGTPPEDPRQLWYSTGAKEKGSSNTIGFANAEVDQIIDKLEYEYDPKKRIALYHRFDVIIHEEQPYTFLYTPKVAFLYRDYLQNVFLPIDRQDLVPGANMAEPDPSIFWLKRLTKN